MKGENNRIKSNPRQVVFSAKPSSGLGKIKFTRRETEVATALLKYHNNKKVAQVLGISLGAVAFHATSIRNKMRVSRTLIAVYLADKMKLLI